MNDRQSNAQLILAGIWCLLVVIFELLFGRISNTALVFAFLFMGFAFFSICMNLNKIKQQSNRDREKIEFLEKKIEEILTHLE